MREGRQVPTLSRGGKPAGRAPNIQDASGGVLIRVSFRERDSAIGHDWAIPVTAAAGEIGDLRSAGWITNVQAAAGIVNVEHAAGDDGTGSTRGVAAGAGTIGSEPADRSGSEFRLHHCPCCPPLRPLGVSQ